MDLAMTTAGPTARLDGGQHWRAVGSLRRRSWGGDLVVFNPLSGQTHALDVVSAEILMRLMAAAFTTAELRSAVAAYLELPEDGRLAAAADDILLRLESAGLAERLG
jgi:PqqD family protein of HPr-rel-A system